MLVAEIHKELRNGFYTLLVVDEADHDRCLFKGSYHDEYEALERLKQEKIETQTRVIKYY